MMYLHVLSLKMTVTQAIACIISFVILLRCTGLFGFYTDASQTAQIKYHLFEGSHSLFFVHYSTEYIAMNTQLWSVITCLSTD